MGLGSGNAKLGLGLLLLALLGSCNRGAEVSDAASVAAESTPTAATDAAALAEDGGYRSTPIDPIRTAQLVTQGEGSQVNLRSQPTTQSDSRGYGLGGDVVTLLRLAEGEGGLSWYYVKFAQSEAEGWVRGDFIDTSAQVAAPSPTVEEITTGPCGDNRPEAFFETKSFNIHLCQTPQGLSYIGTNKTNNKTLTTTDVRDSQGTYIAIDGNQQYHVSDQALAVYQVNGGSYDQLEGEDVIRHERFLY
ncbi:MULTISPECIES: SH3 domain-containing protein [Cyanophyceae]|uniref:SH3 domain-containing protein n=1 Tax=Leptolyngbya subtilissima DQ-A4 TaxID=2933933 RepID=A0ABV0K0V8_9CYAN|nr:SH3 domain-containing protein [Nodosilinea sp. FACHB-141]MBD2110385.1 SH3 domain-containing protein [Nodosilinea sp. FACHB-141]